MGFGANNNGTSVCSPVGVALLAIVLVALVCSRVVVAIRVLPTVVDLCLTFRILN